MISPLSYFLIQNNMITGEKLRNKIFYQLKPLIPRQLQVRMRSQIALQKRRTKADIWPILEEAGQRPHQWVGWPNQRKFAFILMHDVETDFGQRQCARLMALEQSIGFRSSFNFVPERYRVSPDLRHRLVTNGFEVDVHGLVHDGKLYQSWDTFQKRAPKINFYLEEWQAVGFCSPASHHNLSWNHDLRIEYDSSTFDTDPFEPQSDGVKTIFPFWVASDTAQGGYVELPYTLPQDFTLFILLREKNNAIWKRKLAWIADKGGMAMVITHPDYMNFEENESKFSQYPVDYYAEFLSYVKKEYDGTYWHVLPRDVAQFCKLLNRQMSG